MGRGVRRERSAERGQVRGFDVSAQPNGSGVLNIFPTSSIFVNLFKSSKEPKVFPQKLK